MWLGLLPSFAFVFFSSVMMVVVCGRKKKPAKRPKKYADIDGSPGTGSKKRKKGDNTSGNSASCPRTAIPNQTKKKEIVDDNHYENLNFQVPVDAIDSPMKLALKKNEKNATDDAKLSVKKRYLQSAAEPIDEKEIDKKCPPIVVLKQKDFQKDDCVGSPADKKDQQAKDVHMKTCSAGEEVSKGSDQVNSVVKSLVEDKTQKSVEEKKQKSVEDKTQKSTDEGLESPDPKSSTRSQ